MTATPNRVVIENVLPAIDGGRFPVRRTVGEEVRVTADIHTDGHDMIRALLLYRHEEEAEWREVPMRPLVNDRWAGSFRVDRVGRYRFTVEGWVDRFASWRRDLGRKAEADQPVSVDLEAGARMVEEAAGRAAGQDRKALRERAAAMRVGKGRTEEQAVENALDPDLLDRMGRCPDRSRSTVHEQELRVDADRERARFSSWYELFPRSCSPVPGKHGTFRDVERRLPYVAAMGFDVLYLPPIHPIGKTNRKGRNNSVVCAPDDVGSPWAIGSKEGGHTAVHPSLGTVQDFRRLVAKAKEHGIEIALDIAFQCSPDHPYVREHREWFRERPDGSVQYAENPPKKYEDIFPFDFETDAWRDLWEELKRVVEFWIGTGVRIFRVDNPHTKPYGFWEWLIGGIKEKHPDVLFLSEAFTRPKVMYRLAKVGFTQSYTYFAWRNSKRELTEYFTELAQPPVRDFFRPNLWPNTPDILTEQLQFGGRPVFLARLVLAATLGASYGIYGPAFELCENRPAGPGKEEYLDSEKYQLRHWEIDRPDSLREVIALVNRIRRENPALQSDGNLRFHDVDNDRMIAYSKSTPDRSSIILTVVNLDPHYTQSGWIELPLEELGLDPAAPFQGHDLLSGARYLWHGRRIYLELRPHEIPAHIVRLRR
ncbi:MAG TPA: alpha-1,4-glucan--maltose-1-phosphate maltosyltransferase, partial [Candidatus Deferrimicrobiaceae bacterium]